MDSDLQKIIQNQNDTIRQLAETVARSESRYRSLEKMLRFGSLAIFSVLTMILFVKFNDNNVQAEEKIPVPVTPVTIGNSCDSCQNTAQMLEMMKQFAQMIQGVENQLGGTAQEFQKTMQATQNTLSNFDNMMQNMGGQFQLSSGFKDLMAKRIDAQIAGYSIDRMQELRMIKQIGAQMTLMDHVASIDYDFDNLARISGKMADLKNLGDETEATLLMMLTLMPQIAYDMRVLTYSAAPAMGQVSDWTSWMP
jgi:hypothetical protein